MKPEDLLVLKFMQSLAVLRESFRKGHIFLESIGRFKVVSTNVIPFQQIETGAENLDQESLGVSISYAIDAELAKPEDKNRASIGLSLKLWHAENMWKAETEIGWSGYDIGWDPFFMDKLEADNIALFLDKLSDFADSSVEHFKKVA